LTYLDGRGVPELRTELAAYLNRVRGTAAVADDLVITVGFAQGIWLVAMALAQAGARAFAVEDPSLGDSWKVVEAAGLRVVGIPVDEDGLRVDLLERARVGGVLITPAHQYPTGRVLSAERRAALFAWAERRKGIIVEDDYDAEYRYDRQPIGAMQGLRPDHVVYAGSTSKVLAPGLRLGWLVAPPELAARIADIKKAMDNGSPVMDQLAFADFVARGELDRHLRRMRPTYRRRRDLVVAALARHLPELEPVGAAAGLHVLTWLQRDDDPAAIVAAAAEAGIGLGFVERGTGGDPDAAGGLVFGYGTVAEPTIEPGIRRLARLLEAHRASR
jgi:GntR family transcriptional regulator/MocR family aminotransferase